MTAVMYYVPCRIAEDLRLTAIRKTDGSGYYLLSSADLRVYGIERALKEGASPITKDEANELFNLK